MYYTETDLNSYYENLLTIAKLSDEEIVVLQLYNMRKLAKVLDLEITHTSSEVYSFKETQTSPAYVALVVNEFNNLITAIKKFVMADPVKICIREERLQAIELSSKILKKGKVRIPLNHRKKTKFENLRLPESIFTNDSLKSILEKAQKVAEPVKKGKLPLEFRFHINNSNSTQMNKEEGDTEKSSCKSHVITKIVASKTALTVNLSSTTNTNKRKSEVYNNNALNLGRLSKKPKTFFKEAASNDVLSNESHNDCSDFEYKSDSDDDYRPIKGKK